MTMATFRQEQLLQLFEILIEELVAAPTQEHPMYICMYMYMYS